MRGWASAPFADSLPSFGKNRKVDYYVVPAGPPGIFDTVVSDYFTVGRLILCSFAALGDEPNISKNKETINKPATAAPMIILPPNLFFVRAPQLEHA